MSGNRNNCRDGSTLNVSILRRNGLILSVRIFRRDESTESVRVSCGSKSTGAFSRHPSTVNVLSFRRDERHGIVKSVRGWLRQELGLHVMQQSRLPQTVSSSTKAYLLPYTTIANDTLRLLDKTLDLHEHTSATKISRPTGHDYLLDRASEARSDSLLHRASEARSDTSLEFIGAGLSRGFAVPHELERNSFISRWSKSILSQSI